MTYPESLTFLGQARFFGMKLGLDRMRRIAERLGRPQDGLRFIHLAGTNGKGSTAAFCESILRAAGYRVGLYTSPHLVSVRERIQINRVPISETDFAQGMEAVREAMGTDADREATFFEITTALALWYFAREKVDWVVWETGLGGRLDATNIVEPEVCIITNIGLDHQQYLGQTLRDIAEEKAGIIKPGVPVVSAVEAGEAHEVIQQAAKKTKSVLTLVKRDVTLEDLGLRNNKQIARMDDREFSLGLIGAHQIQNAACAVVVMRQLKIADDAIFQGLASTVWPGRFEILSENPLIVLDGAHNPAGTKSLVETWRAFLAARHGWSEKEIDGRAHLVFASVADKDISEMAKLLIPIAKKVSLVRLANERSADPEKLAESFTGLSHACYDSVSAMWENISTAGDMPTLITGSLFLAGEMLARRQNNAEEYKLNERLETNSPKP